MKSIVAIAFLVNLGTLTFAQPKLDYFLPAGTEYDTTIPTPRDILGHELGEWHVSHDKLVQYMYLVASKSPRVSIVEYGRTYEHRPLVLLTITSPSNQDNIEQLRDQHVSLTDPAKSGGLDLGNMPAVVWLGYSVHGNEASGSNASLAVLYHLAAAKGDQIDHWLNDLIILMDPSINPDGLNRFSSWVNVHRSKNLDTSPSSREHNEAWPGGRTNHYWFDLNRDWLPLQHPESQGRIHQFHNWKPNVLTDHHEMGSNSTFFFQPGVPSRNHPLTPTSTITLTEEIANFHSMGLDKIGSLYYSKETFDDFYLGKGSTYPDLNGAVGILFEQASARGHSRWTDNGTLDFPFAMRNHSTTSLTTLEAVYELRVKLLEHQRSFYNSPTAPQTAYVFGSRYSRARSLEFSRILDQHQIQVYHLQEPIGIEDRNFDPAGSFIVPTNQPQHRLIEAIFEKRTEFVDSLFYDVSAWTLPLALNLPFAKISSRSYSSRLVGDLVDHSIAPVDSRELLESDYAYVLKWSNYYSPKALYLLQSKGLHLKVATRPFGTRPDESFDYGTILIPVKNQSLPPDVIHALLEQLREQHGLEILPVASGFSPSGVDLGSPRFQPLVQPKVALIVGNGVKSYEAGEVWHLLDWRFDIDLTLLPIDKLDKVNWNDFNTLIMVDGNYSQLSSTQPKIRSWIETGGTVVAFKNAVRWLSDNSMSKVKFKKVVADSTLQRNYYELDRFEGAQVIGGSIFSSKLDTSHPVNYGFEDGTAPLFVNSSKFFEKPSNAYSYPVVFQSSPLLSGYVSPRNLELLADAPAVIVSKFGKGKIVSFSFNPNFRAFWYGTNRMFLNSLFFGKIIDSKSAD